MERFDVVVVGAGIMGCALARELSRYEVRALVVEQGADVATATSRANSGIVHAGFDAKHGTLKARYNVEGSRLFPKLARELGFAMRGNGSLVLAFTDEELESIAHLLENGRRNGVEGLEIVDAHELRALEPNAPAGALGALHAPTGAIVDPYGATYALAANAAENGTAFRFDTRVAGLARDGEGWLVACEDLLGGGRDQVRCRAVAVCAGVEADRVAALAGVDVPAITARRGEYCVMDKRVGGAFGHTMFRAPSAVGKGVLVSPTVDGNLIVGPNAWPVDRDDPDGARQTTAEGVGEIVRKARDLWPGLDEGAVIARFAGLRATPASGDFTVGEAPGAPGCFLASGIESPGLTAAPAIAVDLAAQVAAYLGARPNAAFEPTRAPEPRFGAMTDEQRARAIAQDPAWGRMVCRCEQVSEAEVVAAATAALPARTLDAVKWRTRAGMGRCHGGFCSPQVTEILARELGCALDEVRKDGAGTLVAAAGGCVKSGPLPQAGAATAGAKGAVAAAAAGAAPAAGAAVQECDVCVVGGGAGGIAAALSAKAAGAGRVVLLDREDALGGILKQCIHPGFGLDRYREELTGPEYAWRDICDLAASDVEVHGSTLATRLEPRADGTYAVHAVGPAGTCTMRARSVVLATGSRERSAGQVELFGTRPAGVYTAGCAQCFTNLMGVLPGRRVVIYGSGDIGLIMARRLHWEGAQVLAVVERAKRPKGLRRNVKQCLEDNGIPLLLNQSVVGVFGRDRVTGVELVRTETETKRPIPGTEHRIDCDTLLLSCGLIPDASLLEGAGGAPVSRGSIETTLPGVYLCGNAARIHDIVDNVTAAGEYVGKLAAAWVAGEPAPEAPDLPDEGAAAVASAEVFDNLPEGAEAVTCICCPKGCVMTVRPDDGSLAGDAKAAKLHVTEGLLVEGNLCKRGLDYARQEKLAPQRTLASLVRTSRRLEPVSVRTSAPVPKDAIPACLDVLAGVCADGPLAVGDVVVPDICGTGADIVATKPLP